MINSRSISSLITDDCYHNNNIYWWLSINIINLYNNNIPEV